MDAMPKKLQKAVDHYLTQNKSAKFLGTQSTTTFTVAYIENSGMFKVMQAYNDGYGDVLTTTIGGYDVEYLYENSEWFKKRR